MNWIRSYLCAMDCSIEANGVTPIPVPTIEVASVIDGRGSRTLAVGL